jgi:hypothetical protein
MATQGAFAEKECSHLIIPLLAAKIDARPCVAPKMAKCDTVTTCCGYSKNWLGSGFKDMGLTSKGRDLSTIIQVQNLTR